TKIVKPAGLKSPDATPAYTPAQDGSTIAGEEVNVPGLRRFSTLTFKTKSSSEPKEGKEKLKPEELDLIEKVRAKGWVLKSWTPEDVEKLKRLVAEGRDERDIAVELHRELKLVQKKIQELKGS
nr:hypothetical protein [Candidatus Sigynarchaeota archaeon]